MSHTGETAAPGARRDPQVAGYTGGGMSADYEARLNRVIDNQSFSEVPIRVTAVGSPRPRAAVAHIARPPRYPSAARGRRGGGRKMARRGHPGR